MAGMAIPLVIKTTSERRFGFRPIACLPKKNQIRVNSRNSRKTMLLIDAIAIVESAGKNVPGDHGAALSPFQIHRAAWDDVKKRFGDPSREIYLNVGDRFEDIATTNADLRMFARNCATGYAFILEERLKRAGQPATPEQIYACWNLGFAEFKAR